MKFCVMAALSRMIKRVENEYLLGFVVGNGGLAVSHLQYIDGTVVFCSAGIK